MRIGNSARRWAAAATIAAALAAAGEARALDTSAREALLVDYRTGAVLLDKNADTPTPPASMSKIMTAYLAFERIREGRLSLEDEIPVSEKAWRKGGSRMFIELGSRVSVADILRGIVVQSGNDAAIALAEALSGSETAFSEEMTRKGRELGMTGSVFRNATGWPDPEHRTTARDLARLAAATIRDFPELYKLYAETSFEYNDIAQRNRNPLLYRGLGADGLKTGYTRAAGYGLTASVERAGRRLILVVNGLPSSRARAREAEALVEWGFREFDNYTLLRAGAAAETGHVWLGKSRTVPLVLEEDLTLTLPRKARKDIRVSVVYDEPIPAPIERGRRLATLRVAAPGMDTVERPLVAGADVERLGVFGRAMAAIGYLLWGPDG